MRSYFYLLFVIAFSTVLACQSPGNRELNAVRDLHNNLVDQRKYTYEVAYSEGFLQENPAFKLFGTGKLTRHGTNSLSRFYFGLEKNQKEHAFFMIHNNGHYTEHIKSVLFDESSADFLADSLQSAILLNPNLLMSLAENEERLEVNEGAEGIHYEFYNELAKRLIIIEADQKNESIRKISIKKKISGNRDYLRTWHFRYLNENDFKEQLSICEQKFESVNRKFL